ncbi:hypothetical protein DSCO28_22150 [Desulfosarcina ovata subsp. sediminis]|uniref:Uncharacterized protein n=1 Tax=Desulfosarcina ovata subsp. sediminis TaxID=885957 RepID=A0A5K7ZPB8_9BACT|nr:hypothetical protein [Desulfosarcina ovata]BBO81649.1 hypothetical protein DSCO28_22150 [Desulfosarcina ovata subsp. sediminis]
MSRPEKRWQLLLVADDGRIIPFRRIKGVAIALVVLVVLLGVLCIGLGWRLTVQNVNHAHTLDQLSEARERADHFKHEHELISAELVLAEARMEKAGLPIPRREESPAAAIPGQTDNERVVTEKTAEGTRPSVTPPAPSPAAPESQASKGTTAPPPVAAGVHPPDRKPAVFVDLPAPRVPQPTPAEPSSTPSATASQTISPSVAVGAITVRYNAATKRIQARFRIRNTGSRRTPVAGRAVMVLGGGQVPTDRWLALPDVTLVDGKPDGRGGRKFRISRFVDMDLSVQSPKDPSVYQTATVYIFDKNGALMVEQTAAVDLPAPAPKTAPAPPPAETETPPPAETTGSEPQADTVEEAISSEAGGVPAP